MGERCVFPYSELRNDAHESTDGGFFVFGDISVTVLGRYRFAFTVYEIREGYASMSCFVVQVLWCWELTNSQKGRFRVTIVPHRAFRW